MKHIFNDKLGHRSLHHVNLLAVPGLGIVKFSGESISPICRVLRHDYTKDGKWSYNSWDVELSDCYPIVHTQDWGTGNWFPGETWVEAVSAISNSFTDTSKKDCVTFDQVQRAIRAYWPKAAAYLDQSENAWITKNINPLDELLAAQEEAAIANVELAAAKKEAQEWIEAREARAGAERIKNALSEAKSGRMSLADLKDLISK